MIKHLFDLNPFIPKVKYMIVPDKVLIVNDSSSGGAAGSTRRMLRELVKVSTTVEQRYFSQPVRDELPIARSLDSRRKRPPFERVIKNISKEMAKTLMTARHERLLLDELDCLAPSLINFRNIHDCGIDHQTLLKIDRSIPLTWTMHDCWPYRPYAFKYDNSKADRVEYALPYKDPEKAMANRRRFFEERGDIVLIAPSRWIADDARKVFPNIRVEQISNGICLDVFRPIQKNTAKDILQLDKNKIWFGFASTWANSRKGLDVLVDALSQLQTLKGVGFVAWGGPFSQSWPSHVPISHFGRIENDAFSRLLYSAVDVFLCPSRADNLPNTCLESLACATPVLGSSAGGIPEMAIETETGWLFDNDSPSSLAEKICQVLDERPLWQQYGDAGTRLVSREYDAVKTAGKYAELFNSLVNETS